MILPLALLYLAVIAVILIAGHRLELRTHAIENPRDQGAEGGWVHS